MNDVHALVCMCVCVCKWEKYYSSVHKEKNYTYTRIRTCVWERKYICDRTTIIIIFIIIIIIIIIVIIIIIIIIIL
jgi:hypothetical protein